jgi:hypothetical protein
MSLVFLVPGRHHYDELQSGHFDRVICEVLVRGFLVNEDLQREFERALLISAQAETARWPPSRAHHIKAEPHDVQKQRSPQSDD